MVSACDSAKLGLCLMILSPLVLSMRRKKKKDVCLSSDLRRDRTCNLLISTNRSQAPCHWASRPVVVGVGVDDSNLNLTFMYATFDT